MKVLYVCTTTDMGGAERALLSLARAVEQEGHTVKIISLKPLGSIGREMQSCGLEVSSLDLAGKWRPLETAGVLARLVQEIEAFRPDIVHAFLYRAIMLCRLAKRRIFFPLITTPHYDLSRKNCFLRLIDRALKDADDVSCAESRSTADFLEKKQKYNPDKLRLVANGVDLSQFRPDAASRQAVRKQFGWAEDEVIFVCVARLSAEKNHLSLLKAFAPVYVREKKAKLVLVGDGPEKERIQEFVRQKGLGKAVFLAGEVSDVSQFLLASDVFILLSSIESLPMSLLEACSSGLPCIVSKVGDMPRVVLHGETGFVCNAQDPVVVSALMAEMIENRPLCQQMGRAARQRMGHYYPAPEKIYLKIYKEIK